MRIFITGATGFVGKHLLERFDYETVLAYRRGMGIKEILRFSPHVIIHAAAEIYNESEMFDSNVKLTYGLLEIARMCPDLEAFIYIGSSSEYGRKTQPMRESDVLEPTNMYEATKASASLLTVAYARAYNLPAMVARPFSLYGHHEPEHRLIPTAIKAALTGGVMKIAPGYHDFIHINDFIDGLILMIANPKPGEIYHFGSGKDLSNEQVVDIVEEVVGRKTKRVLIEKLHDYDSLLWCADITKAKALGWQPLISFQKGIRDVVSRVTHT